MKNVYTSWDINLLADKLIEKIVENWTSPLSSPAVVFTDPKTEQWFKLHWLKSKDTGNAVLMNLKTLRIQQFLFDLVTPETPEAQKIEKLSVELLRDVIIRKLTEKDDSGKYYFQTLNAPDVEAYISADSSINANHLYDFSETIASLFLDYEDVRPDTLNDVLEKSPWQQKLYADVIGSDGIKINDIQYLTLFQLAELNKKENGGSLSFNWPADHPVFIFGFSGLGQIYRSILNDFSKEHSLEIFLQASDNEGTSENQLLKKWADYGQENLMLWAKNVTTYKLDSSASYSKTDTLLHRIQKAVAENSPITKEPFSKKDNSLTLTAAPTRLREVEVLHSRICKLLTQKNNTQLGDILVVAPQIQDYKTAIEQVFDQNDQFSAAPGFPYLPYTIADYSGQRSLTAEALSILFGILKKGYLSRSDVFSLLHNYLVQTVRNISDEDISNWSDWAASLNIFRNREAHDDWTIAKNRLLLSRLTNNLVNSEYLPFENMSSADNDSLYKFIQIIDELKKWSAYAEKEKLSKDDLDDLEELLKNSLLLNDNAPDNLYNESLVFQNVVEEIERQRLNAAPEVFTDCFINALFDRSAAVTLHSSNILTRGITFANFESNRILSAKYVFFMGLDSKSFPGVDKENELDLRKETKRQPGDESISARNKNAFLCQLMAAREGLFFSYVNKNIKKDEDFFKSSVLNDLFQTVYIPGVDKKGNPKLENEEYEIFIKLDEDRPWKELYTQREFRNKKNFLQLQKNDSLQPQPIGQTSISEPAVSQGEDQRESQQNSQQTSLETSPQKNEAALPDRITIGQVKAFLKEPFSYMVNQKLTNDYDDEEKEQFEYEPLLLSSNDKSDIWKKYVQLGLKNENLTAESISFDLRIHNSLPDSYFGELAVESELNNSQAILEKIKEKFPFPEKLIFNENKNQLIKMIPAITPKDWFISGEYSWYNNDYASTKTICTLDFSSYPNILTGYITSLLLLASQPEEEKSTYTVSLYTAGFNKSQNSVFFSAEQSYKTTPDEARLILNKIYSAMFISQFQKCVPLSFIQSDISKIKKGKSPLSFYDFSYSLFDKNASNEWTYFSKKDYFNPETDLGYSVKNFNSEWSQAKSHQIELIKFLDDNTTAIAGE